MFKGLKNSDWHISFPEHYVCDLLILQTTFSCLVQIDVVIGKGLHYLSQTTELWSSHSNLRSLRNQLIHYIYCTLTSIKNIILRTDDVNCTRGVLSGRRPGNSYNVMIQLLCLVRMGTAYGLRRRINYYDAMLMNTERGGPSLGIRFWLTGYDMKLVLTTLRNLQVETTTAHAAGYARDTKLASNLPSRGSLNFKFPRGPQTYL